MYTTFKKYILIPLLVFSGIVFTRCVDLPEEVILPSWDVTFNLPLASDSVFMHELLVADDNENIVIVDSPEVGDSIYLIVVEDFETTTRISDRLEIQTPLSPTLLPIIGNSGSDGLVSATVFNPDPEYHIDSAVFSSGELELLMSNSNFIDVNYELIFPSFKDKTTGEIIERSGSVSGLTTKTELIDLSNVVFSELPVTGVNDLVNYTSQADIGILVVGKVSTTSPTSLNFITQISSSNIVLSLLVGELKRIELDYFEEKFMTDFGESLEEFENKIDFKDIRLKVRAETFGEIDNIKIILDSLNVKGSKNNGSETFGLQFNGSTYYRDSLIAGETFQREFNKSNTNLNDFLSWLPDEIVLGNKLFIDANTAASGTSQRISSEDSIKFIASISAPLHLSIKQVDYSDTLDIDLDQDEKDQLDNALGASLTINVTNGLPIGGVLSVTFMDSEYNELFDLRNSDGSNSFLLSPTAVDSNGKPSETTNNEVTVELNNDEIQDVVNSKYILFNVDVSSTGSTATVFGPNVRIRAKDFFTYKIYGSVNYRVDLEDEE